MYLVKNSFTRRHVNDLFSWKKYFSYINKSNTGDAGC